MNRNLLHLRYRDTSQKYLKFKSRIEKAKETGRFRTWSKSRQRQLILRLEKIWKRLLSLKIQLKMVAAGAALGLGFIAPTFAQTAPGEEFVVNSFNEGNQRQAAVACDEDGDFVVVWEGKYQDGDQSGIYSQRFLKNGTPIGNEQLVNTDTISNQRYADVAMDDDGDYVVVWSHGYGDNSGDGIHLQRFDSDGNFVGTEDASVNTFQTSSQTRPAVAMDADGDFVVVWESDQQDGENYGIFGQRFDKDGIKQGPEFQVNSETAYSQLRPDVAMDEDGDFVITWQSYYQDGSGNGIFYKRYDKSGLAIDISDVQANITTNDRQYDPTVAMDADGDFVIAWTSDSQEGEVYGDGVYFNRFTNQGVRLSSQDIHANIHVTSSQNQPSVAIDHEGDFTIAWRSYGQDDYEGGVFMRRFTRNCDPIDEAADFQVAKTETIDQSRPSIAMDADGDIIIAFESGYKYGNSQDGDGSGIIGVLFEKVDPVLNESEDRYANTTTANNQENPDVSTDGVGNYVIVWDSEDETDDEFRGIYGQLFNKDSEPIGTQFHINEYTDENQDNPAVSMDIDGDFVVVWESYNQDTYYETVMARRFDKNATPKENEFQVNTHFQQNQFRPDVATDTEGNFVVTWESDQQDGDGAGIYARLFDLNGAELKAEWQVNSATEGNQRQPSVAMDEKGDFAITWSGNESEDDHIFVKLFDATGEEKGEEAKVSNLGYRNYAPSVSMDADGDFAIAWESGESKYYDIFVRKFDKVGSPINASEVLVNSFQSAHFGPSIAMDGDGDFVVLWSEEDKYSQGPDGSSVYGRRYDKNADPIEAPHIIHKVSSGDQLEPAAAMDRTGDLVYSWTSENMDNDGNAVVHKSIELQKFPGIEITPTNLTNVVGEDGTTDSLQVKLTDFPCDTVYLTFEGDSDIDWGNGFNTDLVIGMMDTTTQTVVVSMRDDLVDEDDVDVVFNPIISSADQGFDTITVDDVVIRELDNDDATIINITGIPNQIIEGGNSLPYQFALGTIPTDTVRLTISEATANINLDLGNGPGNSIDLVFAPDVTALDTVGIELSSPDDPIFEDDLSLGITVSSSSLDLKYNDIVDQQLAPLTIVDNDSAVVLVNITDGTTSVLEGGVADTVSIALSAIPSSPVTVTVGIGDQLEIGEGQGQSLVLTFPADSSALNAQKIAILAFDDLDGEGDHSDTLEYTVSSSDVNFDNLEVVNTAVSIIDNDGQGLTFTESNNATIVTEGGEADTIQVSLNTSPAGLVTVIATPIDGIDLGNGNGQPDTLIYPAGSNALVNQNLVLTAYDDSIVNGQRQGLINFTIESSDVGYDTLTVLSQLVSIEDNNVANIVVTEVGSNTSVTEGGANDSLFIQLTSIPYDTVRIQLDANTQIDFGNGANTTGEVLFMPNSTALIGQYVSLEATDDLLVEEDMTVSLTTSIVTDDTNYVQASIAVPNVEVFDNDTAGVQIIETNGATIIAEAGDSDTIYVSLTGIPSETVFVTITPDAGIDIGAGPGVGVEYVFAPGQALDLQLIVLSAFDDVLPNGGINGNITFSITSDDPLFNAIPIAPIAIEIIDNDTPSLVVIESGGDTQLIEGEAGENYTIRLSTVPENTVVVTIVPDGGLTLGNGFGVSKSVEFLPDLTALDAQLITIESLNDNTVQGDRIVNVVHEVSSSDLGYDVLMADTLFVSISDDDNAEVIITETNGGSLVSENGLDDSYEVRLTSVPSAEVTVTVIGSADIDLGAGEGQSLVLTFNSDITALDAQMVTISAFDDAILEGEEIVSLVHMASSTDLNYSGLVINEVDVTIEDNESTTDPEIVIPNVLVDESNFLIEGDNSFYSVSLSTIPLDTVFITIYPEDHLDVGEGFGEERTIVFPPDSTSLNTLFVYVEAEDDFQVVGDQTCPIEHVSISSDIVYDNLKQTILLTIRENDVPQTDNPRKVIIYQALSPNGDGIHDHLEMNHLYDYPSNSVSIYNLQGVAVFNMKNYNGADRSWDASSVPDGTYVVSVTVDLVDGSKENYATYVVVKGNFEN